MSRSRDASGDVVPDMTTLRTMGGSLTMADGVLEVVHVGAATSPTRKAASCGCCA